jgi:MoaA/NifB/PqqE/SkfB family radical SAM enzyme
MTQEGTYMEKRFFCLQPFIRAELNGNNVYPCCPAWINDYSFGNFHNNTFEKLWNGEKARKFRQSILDGSYSFCNKYTCGILGKKELPVTSEEEIKKTGVFCPPPKEVVFSYDMHCNVRCIMCRDKQIHNNREETKKLDDCIEVVFLPLCENADTVRINGAGEAFASGHSRKLIKLIAEKYPNINFILQSNGLLLDKANLEFLGINNRIKHFSVSLHAVTEKTYNKIVKGSNFRRIMENLDYIYSQKTAPVVLSFVVSSLNYKEMIPFVKMAKRWEAKTNFWAFWKQGVSETEKNYDRLAIFEEWHPYYNRFVKILQNKIFGDKNCYLYPGLSNLQPISTGKWLKYRLGAAKKSAGKFLKLLRKA